MTSLADIVGDGGVHTIANTGPARWMIFSATGTGAARVGDGNVGAAVGVAVTAGAQPTMFPPCGEFFRYQVGAIKAYVPVSCTLTGCYQEVVVP